MMGGVEQSASPSGVDVAIPCYQYGRFLRNCVTSVLGQGTRNRRVELVARRRNLGQHASFNEAIDWASSKYFMILSADDLLAPRRLAYAVSIMEQHPDVGFAYGRAVWLRPQDAMPELDFDPRDMLWRIVAGEDFLERVCRTAHCHILGPSTVLVRTATQKLAGHYRSDCSIRTISRCGCVSPGWEMLPRRKPT